MTAQIARQYIDGSKADTPSGVSVANFQLGLGNAWDCIQTLGVGLAAVVAGTTALTQANAGLLLIDATAGNVILNLPAATAAVGAVYQFKRLDSTANTVTVNRAGSDTIDGGTSFTLNSQFDYQEIRADGTSAWRVTTPKPLVATTAGTATAYTVTTTPKVLAQADTRIQVNWNVSNGGVACTLAANGGTAFGIKQYDSTGTKIDPNIVANVKADVVFDGTHWVILDPLPPASTPISVQVRQTVASGSVDANGQANFLSIGTGLAVNLAATSVPVTYNFAAGFGTNGAVDYVGRDTADIASAWSSLTASSTLYLYRDRNTSTGALTSSFSALQPVYQTIAPSSPATDQHWFDTTTWTMKRYNGSAWAAVQRVFVGECVTGASTVSSVTTYALMGRYYGTQATLATSTLYSFNHNLGTAMYGLVDAALVCKTAELNYSVGDRVQVSFYPSGSGAGPSFIGNGRNVAQFAWSGGLMYLTNKSTFVTSAGTFANWSLEFTINRRF